MSASAAKRDNALSPADFGFDPARFPSFRKQQLERALDIAASTKRVSCLDAPPGVGKTAVNLLIGLISNVRTLVLTSTKALQTQYMRDAETLGATDIRGQANYRCVALDRGGVLEGFGDIGSSCAEGPCRVGVHCRHRNGGGCGYYDAIEAAKSAQIVVTNYAMWLTLAKHSDPTLIGKFGLLVCDEAHDCPDRLSDFCAVELNAADVGSLLGLRLPPLNEGIDAWSIWAKSAAATARDKIVGRREALKAGGGDRRKLTKELLRLTTLERDLAEMAKARAWRRSEQPSTPAAVPGDVGDWVAYETPTGAKFSPIWAWQYAEEYLFRGIEKVVLSSGTLLPSVVKRLGIADGSYDWHEVKSSFAASRRPVTYVPTVRMDSRANEGQKRIWTNRIDEIVRARMDRKILIHSVSYERGDDIKRRAVERKLPWAKHILTHTSRTTRETIEKFKRSAAPCILITPAAVEGVDFPYDSVRTIIIPKVPFASSTDPVFKARCKQDESYRFECAALLIIQMCGRGMRAADDMVECIVIDDHYSYLRWKTTWPTWVKAAWRVSTTVPSPLKLTA